MGPNLLYCYEQLGPAPPLKKGNYEQLHCHQGYRARGHRPYLPLGHEYRDQSNFVTYRWGMGTRVIA